MRNMKKPLMIAMAALALAVAGCASSEDESFKQDFNAAQAPLEKLITDSSGASDPASMGKIADDAKKAAGLFPKGSDADPKTLAVTATLNGGATRVVTSGTRAYALFQLPDELRILDIANPLQPSQIIAAPSPALASDIGYSAGKVYVVAGKVYSFNESLIAAGELLANVSATQSLAIDGDCAVITGQVRIELLSEGTPKVLNSAFTNAWIKGPKGWQMVAWQSTPLPG